MVWRRRAGRVVELAHAPAGRGILHLRCTALAGRAYRFAYSGDGKRWTTLGDRLDGSWLPPWDAGVRVALAVGGALGARGRFTALEIASTPAPVSRLSERMSRRARLAALLTRAVGAPGIVARPG